LALGGVALATPYSDNKRVTALRPALGRARRRRRQGASARAFGLRLLLAVAAAFAVIGALANVVITDQLKRRQLDTYVRTQLADVESFEATGREAGNAKVAVREVSKVINAIGRRPGTLETLLIDERRVVRASGADPELVGTKDSDSRIEAAFQGERYAGHEADPAENGSDFELVAPVGLPGGRYVFEVSYDHRLLEDQFSDVRRTLSLLGLAALIVGGGVFYVVGGRSLMRAHRGALQRATLDGLTDLPNQRAFHDELPQAVASATRHEVPLALAALDVDDFKFLNDRHGHPQGDALLRRVADILRAGRSGDRAYRVGGDEFALLLPHTDAEGARTLAGRLVRALADEGAAVSVGVSALRTGERADTLRAEGDAALYEAKRRGGSCVAHFDEIRDHVVITTSDKRDSVDRLIDEGSLTIVFQPIWDLDSGVLLGLEALSRPDPAYGLSGPAEMFDVAEQIGRVHDLDVLCAQRALQMAAQVSPDALLFLNLAPQTLDLDAENDDWLKLAVQRAGLPLERVVVEVTERFGGRTTSVVKCLQRLREQGFKLALDDVGTGDAGLEMLRKVGAEYVKIDRSIVVAAATEPNARAVLMAMATFAWQTGSFVIAEGIEDQDTLAFLRGIDDLGLRAGHVIQGGQGYGLGRPSPEPTTDRPDLLADAPVAAAAHEMPSA
jgi:diguanylate cyclase (GGDEF)-like protein